MTKHGRAAVTLGVAATVGCLGAHEAPAPGGASLIHMTAGGSAGPREGSVPLAVGASIRLAEGPAGVSLSVAELGAARAQLTRAPGSGPAAIYVKGSWGTGGAERWLVAGDTETQGGWTLGFETKPARGTHALTVRRTKDAFVAILSRDGVPDSSMQATPGVELRVDDLRLTIEDWLPSSEAWHRAIPDVRGAPAARLVIHAPEGDRPVWLLLDDPLSHVTLGGHRLRVGTP